MQTVGQKLRDARVAQGYSLEEVHSKTRISVRMLAAIEADDLGSISSAFLYRSFIRQLAELLLLDYEELLPSVLMAAEKIPAPLVPGEEDNAPAKVATLHLVRRRSFRWVQSLTSFALALVACSAIYALWQSGKLSFAARHEATTSQTVDAVARVQSEKTAPAPGTGPAAPQQVAKQRTSPPEAEQKTAADGFTLELSATEPAWLSIIADGKVSFKGILARAQTKVLEGHHIARIRTGNAGAVEAVFNGRSIGALGSKGQVRTVVFTRDDYEVLRSPARASLRIQFNPTFELTQIHQQPQPQWLLFSPHL